MKYSKWLDKHIQDLKNKTIVVTGANSGLGFECCRALLYKKANIIMACRNLEKANIAKDILINEFPNSNIEVYQLDISSFISIHNFVNNINLNNIDVLINNAGIYHQKKDSKTKDKIELTIGTNYFGMFYLNKLIEEKIKDRQIKIINVTSLTAKYSRLDLNDLGLEKVKNRNSLYAKSKLAISSYTLAKQQENTNMKYYLTHPGISATNIINNFPKWFKILGNAFMKIVFHSPEKACLSLLAPLSNLEGNNFGPRVLQINGYPKKIKYPKKIRKLSKDIIEKSNHYLQSINSNFN